MYLTGGQLSDIGSLLFGPWKLNVFISSMRTYEVCWFLGLCSGSSFWVLVLSDPTKQLVFRY